MKKRLLTILILPLFLSSCSLVYASTRSSTIFDNKFSLWNPIDKSLNANSKKSYFTVNYNGYYFYHLEFNDGTYVQDSGTYVYENYTFKFLVDGEVVRKTPFSRYYETQEEFNKDGVVYILTWHAQNIFD